MRFIQFGLFHRQWVILVFHWTMVGDGERFHLFGESGGPAVRGKWKWCFFIVWVD